MIDWIKRKAIAFALRRFFGASSGAAAELAPRVLRLIAEALAIVEAVKSEGKTEAEAVETADRAVLRPRKMTAEEERRWFDRMTETGG